jgi:O-antigen/teichoic acid export membrane protein
MVETVGSQGIRFLVGILLARILMPEDFGLVAMLTLFIALGQILLDSGFGAALIQRSNVTEIDICSVFYFNVFVGLTASVFLCLIAPWIAEFFNQPSLTQLTMALSLIFIFNSFGMIQGTLFTKKVDFESQAKVTTIAGLSSGIRSSPRKVASLLR